MCEHGGRGPGGMPPEADEDELPAETFEERLAAFRSGWAMAEFMLGALVAAISRNLSDTSSQGSPHTTAGTIEFFERSFSRVPEMRTREDHARSVVRIFRAEKDLRNTIIHAPVLKIERNGTAHFLAAGDDGYALRPWMQDGDSHAG